MKPKENWSFQHHCLVTDCQTRLGSIQKMVSKIFEQQKAIHKVLHDYYSNHYFVTTWQDIHVVLSLDAALGTLSGFTYMLLTENLITVWSVSAILFVINCILKKEVRSIGDNTQLAKDIKTWILTYLEQRYTDVEICESLNLANRVNNFSEHPASGIVLKIDSLKTGSFVC